VKDKSILTAAFFSSFGSTMYFIVVAWILYELTSDATYTGLMVGFGFLPGVFMNLVFGVWADRANRKTLTILATGIILMSITALWGAMLLDVIKPWMLIAVHMSVQTFASLFRTAQQAFITEVYEKKEIPRIFSHQGSAVSVGGLVGTSFGGFALHWFSAGGAVGIVLGSFCITLLCLGMVSYEPKERAYQPASVFRDLTDGFRYIHRVPLMYSLLGLMFVGQLVVHTTAGMLSVYTSARLQGDAALYGILESAASLGAIVAGVTATFYLYKVKYHVPFFALLATALGLLGMAVFKEPVIAFGCIFVIGLGTTWLRVLMQSVQQVATEPAFYGRMAATRQTINQTSVAIGAPVLGVIADGYGVQYSYAALLAPVLLLGLMSLRIAKRGDFSSVISSVLPKDSDQGYHKSMS
jgi:DHA3 family macrolide efflux protein-like MFS transporter